MKNKTPKDKTDSSLSKDLNRIRKITDSQTKMNILRKYQIKLLNNFLHKLIQEKRITKEELKKYMPKKKDAEKVVFRNH